MANWRDYITVDPTICHGQACITGIRIMMSGDNPRLVM